MPPVPAFDRLSKKLPALLFDRVEPDFDSVVTQRRPSAATIDIAWWYETGGCPHPHTWTLAAERRPSSRKGLTAVAMRPQAQSPVCGWGLTLPRHRSSFISPHQARTICRVRTCPSTARGCRTATAAGTGAKTITGGCRPASSAVVPLCAY
jgi:hypothetical protein